jgi:hypothetical protein
MCSARECRTLNGLLEQHWKTDFTSIEPTLSHIIDACLASVSPEGLHVELLTKCIGVKTNASCCENCHKRTLISDMKRHYCRCCGISLCQLCFTTRSQCHSLIEIDEHISRKTGSATQETGRGKIPEFIANLLGQETSCFKRVVCNKCATNLRVSNDRTALPITYSSFNRFGLQITETKIGSSRMICCPFCKRPCRVDNHGEEIMEEHIKKCLAKTIWMNDKATNQCVRCSEHFTTTRRKHHCRKCKVLVCSSCCPSNQTVLIDGKQSRVCNTCIRFTI